MPFKINIDRLSNYKNLCILTLHLSWSSAKSRNNYRKYIYINVHTQKQIRMSSWRFILSPCSLIWAACEFSPQCRDTESTFMPSFFFPVQGFHSKQNGFYSSWGTQVLMIINHQAGKQLLLEQCNSLGTCLWMDTSPELNNHSCGYSKNINAGGASFMILPSNSLLQYFLFWHFSCILSFST